MYTIKTIKTIFASVINFFLAFSMQIYNHLDCVTYVMLTRNK